MLPVAHSYYSRVRTGLRGGDWDFSIIPEWLEENTGHPKIAGAPWSFQFHEYQKRILIDSSYHVCVRKCSQVGMSELSIRMVLAILAIFGKFTAIYTLPTTGFANKFSQDRIDRVIEDSRYLSDLISKKVNSSSLKKLGTSSLYLVGTFSKKAAISIDGDLLIRDEVDFSNQEVLTAFISRLGHATNGGIIRDFSTPTVSNFGISKTYEESTQSRYMIECDHCHNKVAPSPLQDIIIPGYDKEFINFDENDLANPAYLVDQAYLQCPACEGELTQENLLDPMKREWVEEFSDRTIKGYQVMPFDVPKVNPVPKSVKAISTYKQKSDYVNFELGQDYEDADNSFLESVIARSIVLPLQAPREGIFSDTYMGIDVGKTSWIVIGKRASEGSFGILHAERVSQSQDNALVTRAHELMKWYGVIRTVIDAGPDFTSGMMLQKLCEDLQVLLCYYKGMKPEDLAYFNIREEDGLIKADRTISLNTLCKLVNSGGMKFQKGIESDIIKSHFGNIKRVSTEQNTGTPVNRWIKTGPEHYVHACNYALLAEAASQGLISLKYPPVSVLPQAKIFQLRGESDYNEESNNVRNGW